MKTKNIFRTLLVAIFFLLMGIKANAQTFVKPEQIKTANIASYLKSKDFEIAEQTEAYLKINKKGGTRSMYLDLKDGNRNIFFNIAYKLVDHVDATKLENYLKKVNDYNVIKVRHFEKTNDVQIEYYFWTKNGFSYESLLDAIEEFFLYEGDCINNDTDKILQ